MPRPKHGKNSEAARPTRAKSTASQPSKPQVRTLRERPPSPVQKTKSEAVLIDGFKRLNIRKDSHTRRIVTTPTRGLHCMTDVASYLLNQKVKNIVVMVGAGISTPSGIPDFRSPGTGLYHNLKQYNLPHPESVFDIDYFERYPKAFYTLAKELYPSGKYVPNYIHYFLKVLYQQGLLLRVYTQNIDGLERMCGIPAVKLVEAHGTFLTASCVQCHEGHSPHTVKEAVFKDKVPRCKKYGCFGLVKPDIVFFGEDLPRRFYYYLKDFPQADMVLVMGTSLAVEPFAGLIDSGRFHIPRILFNRKAVGVFKGKRRMNDLAIEGDIVENLKEFVDLLGWRNEMDELLANSKQDVEAFMQENHITPETAASATAALPPKSPALGNERRNSTGLYPTPPPPRNSSSLSQCSNSTVASSSSLLSQQGHLKDMQHLNSIGGHGVKAQHAVKGMQRLNGMAPSSKTSTGSRPTLPKQPSSSWLPRIGHTRGRYVPGFHAQKTLYRTNRNVDSSSSSSSESESSDSDED